METPTVTTQSQVPGATKLRVVLLMRVREGAEQRLLRLYERMRLEVAQTPGYLHDQLCQATNDPAQWLITSEWESMEHFSAWETSQSHEDLVHPLHSCVSETRPMRFTVARETSMADGTATAPGKPAASGPRSNGDRVVRHALVYPVKPGSEAALRQILAEHGRKQAKAAPGERLQDSSIFIHGNHVVRTVAVGGSGLGALHYLAAQPEMRAVEQSIDPYLEEKGDLSNPHGALFFYSQAALSSVSHTAAKRAGRSPKVVGRHALWYPVRAGCGERVAELIAQQDELAAKNAAGPLVTSTIFLRDDTLIRLLEFRGPLADAPSQAAGTGDTACARELGELLDLDAGTDLTTDAGKSRLVAESTMTLIADRQAKPKA